VLALTALKEQQAISIPGPVTAEEAEKGEAGRRRCQALIPGGERLIEALPLPSRRTASAVSAVTT
jgi:hypothetical protein